MVSMTAPGPVYLALQCMFRLCKQELRLANSVADTVEDWGACPGTGRAAACRCILDAHSGCVKIVRAALCAM